MLFPIRKSIGKWFQASLCLCLTFTSYTFAEANSYTLPPLQPATNSVDAGEEGPYKIAIIIDDIGYNYKQGLEAINLPGAITYAIIPHSPKAHFFAIEANKYNKEIMLHAPMSAIHRKPLGKYGLTEQMDEVRFKHALNQSLDTLPGALGVNNHMGSLLTQKELPMGWVMESLQKRDLYFIDSRTSSSSVAWDIAQNYNIPSLQRDVFLDHTPTMAAIANQFKRLTDIAKKRGYAVAIGHPYPQTIEYLKKVLPTLKKQQIELVSASILVKNYSPNLVSHKSTQKRDKLHTK